MYEGRDGKVASLFMPGEKKWNTTLVRQNFVQEDADAILETRIPQRDVADQVVWVHSSNGAYTAKRAYHFWYESNIGLHATPSCVGWKRIWHLNIPHKIKVFVWRYCRNVVPVRWRLNSRGIRIPITCPMCETDVEHMIHLFYDYSFATECWNHVGLTYDWSQVECAHGWLLQKLTDAKAEELLKICMVLWGIWYWKNKKVWDGKVVTAAFAMDSSFQILAQ
ncbi:uncharacterized protein LOC141708293 [Apium graveolens]|uniref:uncharacterized protein LOC141708293 n=1 Tax=Apium graveolens TaxID=4045 RepID=UPI003D7C0D52